MTAHATNNTIWVIFRRNIYVRIWDACYDRRRTFLKEAELPGHTTERGPWQQQVRSRKQDCFRNNYCSDVDKYTVVAVYDNRRSISSVKRCNQIALGGVGWLLYLCTASSHHWKRAVAASNWQTLFTPIQYRSGKTVSALLTVWYHNLHLAAHAITSHHSTPGALCVCARLLLSLTVFQSDSYTWYCFRV